MKISYDVIACALWFGPPPIKIPGYAYVLTYGYESWVMTELVRSQVQASKMSFLRRIEEVTLLNKVRSCEIRKSHNIEQLLLRIERSQLRWFGYVRKMLQEGLPKQALLA